MQTKAYTTIDRAAAGWPSGEWNGEPDKVQWSDAETGLPCLAVRNQFLGNWCGYVGVQKSHSLYEVHYADAPSLDVHGGLTYSDKCQPEADESRGICHLPAPGEDDHVWWFGFDCAHCYDWSPMQAKHELERGYPFTQGDGESYKTLDYVKEECRRLASQLAEFT